MIDSFLAGLQADSTLADLPADDFHVGPDTPGQLVAAQFKHRPDRPGVIVRTERGVVGMISRTQFLDCMSRPFYPELYLNRPIKALVDNINVPHLETTAETGIDQAVKFSLTRPTEQLYEPIVVDFGDHQYRLSPKMASSPGPLRRAPAKRSTGMRPSLAWGATRACSAK
jgi:hypothetical protein